MSRTRRKYSRARRFSPGLPPAVLLAIFWLVPGILLPLHARAAEGVAPSSTPSVHQGNGPGAQLVRETREVSGEDENAEFKLSAAIRFISRITGLTPEGAYWLCAVVNFGIIAGAIVGISRKHLPPAFRSRTASIQRAMQEARRASQEANLRLAEIEARLSRLDGEIARMQATAESEAAAEEARIQAAAEDDARRIVESTEQEIAAMAKATRRELTAYAADLAVNLAKQQAKVDTATDQALVRQFAQRLAGDGASREGRQ